MQRTALLLVTLFAHTATADVRKTPAFHAIEITGSIVVEARIDPSTTVEVRGDADKVGLVTTDINAGTLVIGTTGKLVKAKLRVIVTVPELSALVITGTGEITATGLDGDHLDVRVTGTARLSLSGKTADLRIAVPGTASLTAKDLVATSASVDIKGTLQAEVHATKTLAVDVDSSGTAVVKVHGSPKITKSVKGTAVIN